MQVEVDRLAEKKLDESKGKDESGKKDEPTEQEETEDKSDTPSIEFEDQMYELMQETEMTTEYQEMTSEREKELVSQLTLRQKAEYWEMKEYYQLQAREMELRSAEIKEKARQHAPGLPMDVIQALFLKRVIRECLSNDFRCHVMICKS